MSKFYLNNIPGSRLTATSSSSASVDSEGDEDTYKSVLPQSSCAHLGRGAVWTAIDVSVPASKTCNYGPLCNVHNKL